METELERRCEELRDDLRSDLAELQRAANIEAAQLRQELAEGQRTNWQLAQDLQATQEEAADLRRQLEECQAKLVKSVPLSIYKLAVRSADAEDAILLRILPDLITEAKETPPVEGDWQQRLSDL